MMGQMKDIGIRAGKTAAQAAVAMIGTAVVMQDVDWEMVISAAALAGIASILNNLALCTVKGNKPTVDEEAEAMIQRDMEEAALLKSGTVAIATDDVPDGALEPNEDGSINVYDSRGNKTGTVPAEVAEKAAGEVTHVLVDGELKEIPTGKAQG